MLGTTSLAQPATVTLNIIELSYTFPRFITDEYHFNPFLKTPIATHRQCNYGSNFDSQSDGIEFQHHDRSKDTSSSFTNSTSTKIANFPPGAVQISFWDDNPEIMGNVFPSQSFRMEGPCRLYMTILYDWIFVKETKHYHQVDGDCWGYNQYCGYNHRRCAYSYHHTNPLEKVKYECHCDAGPKTILGDQHKNSMVDFRNKQNIYQEIPVPSVPVKYEYESLCLPSSLSNRGGRVNHGSPTTAYNCENATAVRRTSKSGTYMMYNLGTGDDQIYLNPIDTTNNCFVVDNGKKTFYGSAGTDIFYVIGTCSNLAGHLDGGLAEGGNVLVLSETCATGEALVVDLEQGVMTSGQEVNLSLSNLETLYGRQGQPDEIRAGSASKLINGRGGENGSLPDIVRVSDLNCDEKLFIVAENYTTIHLAHSRREVTVVVPRYEHSLEFVHLVKSATKLTRYSFKTPSREILHAAVWKWANTMQLVISFDIFIDAYFSFPASVSINSTTFTTNPEDRNNMPTIHLEEDQDGLYSSIGVDENLKVKVIHRLTENKPDVLQSAAGDVKRFGAWGIPNIFYLISGDWDVVGGLYDDTFVIKGLDFSGHINGEILGHNTLVFDKDVMIEYLRIDLLNKVIDGLPNKIYVENIQNIQGRCEKGDEIICSCDTEVINGQSGSANNTDLITVPHCLNSTTLTILVPKRTSVVNYRGAGNFIYEILDDNHFEISANHSNSNKHTYRFLFSIKRIVDLKFERFNQSLTLKFASRKILSLALTNFENKSQEFTNPAIIFQETDGRVTEIRVKKSGLVYSSTSVRKATERNVHGFESLVNEFWINFGRSGRMGGILRGGNEDDSFWLQTAGYIGTLDGAAGTNALILQPQLYPDDPLFVDMRKDRVAIKFGDATPLIERMNNIQRFRGRRDAFESVLAACDTKLVASADEIWFADWNCNNYNVILEIEAATKVGFLGDSNNERAYAGGNIYYKFEVLRSFDPNFDFWFAIRDTRQVYYLKFVIEDLEAIRFSQKASEVQYVISNATYRHSVDKYLELDQQFYGQPRLMTSEGFRIKIARDGEIFLTLEIRDTDVSLLKIQNELVPTYSRVANKLNVTIIVRTKSDLIYIGNRGDSDRNILTNSDSRSHLVGGRGAEATYVILDLKADVFIYAGFESDNVETQLVDLSEVVWRIRNEVKTKYVPRFAETAEGHLEISIDDFKSDYPGKVIIVGGAENCHRLKFLFNSVVMHLDQRDRTKRSIENRWNLSPMPIVIDEDTLNIVTPDDFEYGQEIVVSRGSASLTLNASHFQFVRKDNELILTNMGSESNMTEVASLMFFDFFNRDKRRSSNTFQDLTIKLGDSKIEMNFSDNQLPVIAHEVFNFDEMLERMEETLLQNLPEIKSEFKIQKRETLWKTYKDLFIGLMVFSAIIFVFSIFIASIRPKRSRENIVARSYTPISTSKL